MNDIDLQDINLLQANWNYPAPIRFGVGRIIELPAACQELNICRPLLVTDQGLAAQDFVQALVDNIKAAGMDIRIFCDIKPNPTGANIKNGVDAYKINHHDGVIAIGGGSALDAGKAIALMMDQDYPLWDFEDVGSNWTKVNPQGIAPVIAIPTTAGTGSEVGRASVILDETDAKKKIIFHPNMLPDLIIEDPRLCVKLPPGLTAATGVDAFVHCLEAYCAPFFHPMADGIALEGMRLIKEYLPLAVSHGKDLHARAHMLIASSMGATAFQKGLGAIHALAHPLGALYDKHHGLLNAILMPYVLLRNKPAITARLQHIAHYLQLSDVSYNGFIDWILSFRRQLDIPNTLAEIGLTSEDKQLIGELARQDPSAAANPIQFNEQVYTEIFVAAVSGQLQ